MAVDGYILAKTGGGYACDVAICRAACCRSASFRPDRPGPCEYLTADYRCELHVVGGPPCKPSGCLDYPRHQRDVDTMNAHIERAGIAERCILRVAGDG